MKYLFLIFLFLISLLNASSTFSDDFHTDTTSEYSLEDTWTKGGVGSFSYDSAGEQVHVLTGNDIALKFSHYLPASEDGSFSIDFLPTAHYPSGGVFTLKLIQDDQTYYKIKNSDGYGPKEISKYINGVEVDSVLFNTEYSQNNYYTITITFSPSATTVQAFGETATMNSDETAITVNSFSVDTTQQDAYYDNIIYNSTSSLQIISPLSNHIQTSTTLIAQASVSNMEDGWGVKFILDKGEYNEQIAIDTTAPFSAIFNELELAEHKIDCYIVNELQIEQTGEENHDSVQNIAVGDILVAIGDSITEGHGDDLDFDNISADGRNTGGGFTPLLNDHLSNYNGYPTNVINEGIGGESTQEGLDRLPSLLSKYPEASTFLVLYGTNNTSSISSQPLESGKGLNIGDPGYEGTYKDYMQQIIDMINNAGKKVAVAKIPIALGTSSKSGDYSEPIEEKYRNVKARDFNEAIDELIAIPSNNITITPPDFYTYFRDTYVDEYFDNLHPNGFGYRSMADLWRDSLTE
jgi:lysophospholipase L1-like esterase